MAMQREDYATLTSYVDEAMDYIEDGKPQLAKITLEMILKFLERQQFNKPRGNPFEKGEDLRRKDRLAR